MKRTTTAKMMFLGCLLASLLAVQALITTQTPATKRTSLTSSLQATTTKQVVYDGPEWSSIQDCLGVQTSSSESYGKMTVVVGTREDSGDKIVGVVATSNGEASPTIPLKDSNLQVYAHSVATVPSNIQDQVAMNTMICALTGVQLTLPRVEGVGGGVDESMVAGKVVVLGGSDYACFAAEGLAALGSQVSLVSTNKVNLKNGNVEVLPPAVGDDEIGFATHIGDFDSLLDTADDERPSRRFSNDDGMTSMGTTLRLLQQRHNCERYVSSMTKAQSIVKQEGVFFGPGKVKNHVNQIQQQIDTFQSIVPPPSFGTTVETLLQKGIVYQNDKDFVGTNTVVVRGWSLKDFMETSTWPSDSSGGGGSRMVRYGLPVVEEGEDDEGEFTMISAPPKTDFIDRKSWDKDIAEEEQRQEDQDMKNPFVQKIVGEQGMYDTIVKEKRDCVLFLSAAFCRTCKQLNPKFTSLARRTMEDYGDDEDGILFAKADASGDVGKDLSKLLNVDSVPAFFLFRNGRRYGPAMSISRMPSKKLSAAIEMLESGMDWDTQAIQKAEENRQ